MMVDLPISSTACRYGEITWDAAAGKAGGSHAGRSDSAAADIGKSLAVYGEWREREIVFLSQFLAPGAAVLDVGAGIGALALGFARRVAPGGRVLAVEPRAAEAALLAVNVARNAPDVVVVASLDDVAAARPALVRIDEATDPAALVAAFAASEAVIAVEIASLATAASAFRHLDGSGRRLWFADFAAFNPENFRAVPGNVLGFRHDAVLLALPAGAADPEPATARVLAPVADLEGFADHFLRMPRARDATMRERDLDVLRQRLAEIEADRSRAERAFSHVYRERRHVTARDLTARNDLSRELSIDDGLLARLTKRRRGELRGHRRLLERSGLFDRDYYLAQNADVAAAGAEPLLHYLLFGAYEGRRPNAYFDSRAYIAAHNDVAASGINPLVHFHVHGGREGRFCGDAFDAAYYLSANPDVVASGENPLAHFLRVGLKEGRLPAPGRVAAVAAPMPTAPPPKAWSGLRARSGGAGAAPLVDIVVPVYRGYDDTLACLHSVLAAPVETPFELVVVDDRSPDVRLSTELARLAALGLFTLLVNEENRGFVGSTNRGMALHPDRDVLLLNSDTVVYNDWLDRLRAQAKAGRVATVTPLSNNATICSYPLENTDNVTALEVEYAELDRMAAAANAGLSVEVPTGVGFCMYVARDCLAEIGLFDEPLFGRGYGEENDLCRRAAAAGWSNRLAGDVFVRHTGEVSFAGTATGGKSAGLKAVLGRHPDYLDLVNDYIARKPAAAMRQRLDAARLARLFHRPNGAVAFFSHAMAGGVVRHLDDLEAMIEASGRGVVMVTPSENGISVSAEAPVSLPNLKTIGREDIDTLVAVLAAADVRQIHVHSLIGWADGAPERVPEIARRLGVPFDFTFHDYWAISPEINLIGPDGIYCGEAGEATCRQQERYRDPGMPRPDPDASEPLVWRERHRRFVLAARRLFAPSEDAARRLARHLPDVAIRVLPHPEPAPTAGAAPAAVEHRAGEPLRVAIIGAIGPHKGSKLLAAMAEDAIRRKLPIEFVIVGYTDRSADLRALPNVTVTGRYREEEAERVIAEQRCHLAFIPSVWPETYCYTLSIALRCGFPTAVFDLGAQRDRLLAADPAAAIVLPLDAMTDAALANDRLLEALRQGFVRPARTDRLAGLGYTFDSYYGT